MIAKHISRATAVLAGPPGMDDCGRLYIRGNNSWVESAWEPTPRELAQLNQGGHVILRVAGRQPPVQLYVEPRPPAEEDGHG